MKKILVPVDFSDYSKFGTELAVTCAAATGAEIHFLNIVTLPSHVLLTPEGEIFDDGDFKTSEVHHKKEAALQSMQDWVSTHAPGAKGVVLYGHVNEGVLSYSKRENISLIILGTHKTEGLLDKLNATHGEHIAMHAEMPVLTLKCDRSDMKLQSIVLASSFTEDDISNVEVVLNLQKAFDAHLYLLRVHTARHQLNPAEAEAHMHAFAKLHGIENYEVVIAPGTDVETGIMQFVASKDVDIIAMGSHQRTGLNRWINGCISADVIKHLDKPILTFKI